MAKIEDQINAGGFDSPDFDWETLGRNAHSLKVGQGSHAFLGVQAIALLALFLVAVYLQQPSLCARCVSAHHLACSEPLLVSMLLLMVQGSSSYVGAMRVTVICKRLMYAAKNHDKDEVIYLYTLLSDEFPKSLGHLERIAAMEIDE